MQINLNARLESDDAGDATLGLLRTIWHTSRTYHLIVHMYIIHKAFTG